MIYYGLLSGLPVLSPCKKPYPDIGELRTLLGQYIGEHDREILHHFFYQIDLINYNAIIQQLDVWMEGGNFNRDTLKKWIDTGETSYSPFQEIEFEQSIDKISQIDRLQKYWQTLYDHLMKISGHNIQRLLNFEISYKNFFKSYLERKIANSSPEYYINGGWFDRFSYRKLLLADIQAEHPYLAGVLRHIDIQDPFERELKIEEAKWTYYDYVAFFEPFSMSGLISWLFKYLDVHKWQYNNYEAGRQKQEAFLKTLLQETESYY